MKHIDKHVRRGRPATILKPFTPRPHHYPKGFPRTESQMYSESLSGHSLVEKTNIGRQIGEKL